MQYLASYQYQYKKPIDSLIPTHIQFSNTIFLLPKYICKYILTQIYIESTCSSIYIYVPMYMCLSAWEHVCVNSTYILCKYTHTSTNIQEDTHTLYKEMLFFFPNLVNRNQANIESRHLLIHETFLPYSVRTLYAQNYCDVFRFNYLNRNTFGSFLPKVITLSGICKETVYPCANHVFTNVLAFIISDLSEFCFL